MIKGWEKGRLGKNKWINLPELGYGWVSTRGGGVRGYDGAGMETLDSPSLWAIHGLTMGFNWTKNILRKESGPSEIKMYVKFLLVSIIYQLLY